MQQAYNIVIALVMLGVVIILFLGLWNMFKGNDSNRSQQLMRARVIAQALAIALLMGALFFFGRSST